MYAPHLVAHRQSTPTPQHLPVQPLPFYDDLATSELLAIAAVLPEQFYSPPANAYAGRPEAALMRAVLEDAVSCFQREFFAKGRRAQRLAKEAAEWFFAPKDTQWPFSFENICTVLGLDAEYIRRGLKRWRQCRPAALPKRKRRVVVARRPLKIAA
jgi:hypothetical protein